MTSIDQNTSDALNAEELKNVVGGVMPTPPTEPPPEGEVVPPTEGDAPPPPPTPPTGGGTGTPPTPPTGSDPATPPTAPTPATPPTPPTPPTGSEGGETTPPMTEDGPPEGVCPPPHPEGYVNGFIEPLFEGLDYVEDGDSSWTLPIDPAAVNSEDFTFVVSADECGTWEGGIPPEATDNGDGTYTIQCWPFDSVTDNGDGTVTLEGLKIGPMMDGGEEAEAPAEGGETVADVTPPHPEGDVNDFIEPLYDGLTYNAGGVSEWTLPIGAANVDEANNTFTVPADEVGDASMGLPLEATDNGDGTYTISCWPISGVVDNGDGTVTLSVDIGPMVA